MVACQMKDTTYLILIKIFFLTSDLYLIKNTQENIIFNKEALDTKMPYLKLCWLEARL